MKERAWCWLEERLTTQGVANRMDHLVQILENLFWCLAGLKLAVKQLQQLQRGDGAKVS